MLFTKLILQLIHVSFIIRFLHGFACAGEFSRFQGAFQGEYGLLGNQLHILEALLGEGHLVLAHVICQLGDIFRMISHSFQVAHRIEKVLDHLMLLLGK